MTHRAALYAVTVHPKRNPDAPCILGDYDANGTWLGKTLKQLMPTLSTEDDKRNIGLKFESRLKQLPKNHAGFTFLRGQTGVRSILSRQNEVHYRRTPETEELLRVAAVFWLPRRRSRGYLAIHIPHGRGIKSLFDAFLRERFSKRNYVLSLSPIVPQDALRNAVQADSLERITLVKRDLSDSDRFADAAQWGPEQVGRLELSIISRRGLKLWRDPLTRFLSERRSEGLDKIIEFDGMRFDEAKVTAKMPGGNERTFYLDGRESGHAITIDLELNDDSASSDDMGIRSGLLMAQLTDVLSQLTPST